MIVQSVFKFKNTNSTGVEEIPNGTLVYIEDSDGIGNPLLISVINTNGLVQGHTIQDLLNDTSRYKIVSSPGNIGELEQVIQNGKIGYRIRNRNTQNYGDVGFQSVDLSYSDKEGDYGASGDYSFCAGYTTKAAHNSSFVNGYETQSGRDHQTVFGIYNEGKNDTLFEIGNGTETQRKNALELYEDGTLVLPQSSKDVIASHGQHAVATISVVQDIISSTGIGNTLAGLEDVDVEDVQDGDLIAYNEQSEKWEIIRTFDFGTF